MRYWLSGHGKLAQVMPQHIGTYADRFPVFAVMDAEHFTDHAGQYYHVPAMGFDVIVAGSNAPEQAFLRLCKSAL